MSWNNAGNQLLISTSRKHASDLVTNDTHGERNLDMHHKHHTWHATLVACSHNWHTCVQGATRMAHNEPNRNMVMKQMKPQINKTSMQIRRSVETAEWLGTPSPKSC
jgi:hypothetical protein